MPDPGHDPTRPRFFCGELPIIPAPSDATPDPPGPTPEVSDPVCQLDRTESHHARNVLRLSVGSVVELFDGRGTLAQASLEGYESKHARCRVTRSEYHPPNIPALTIAAAVPKGPRADAMVAQLSQLGVDTFIPLHAEYSVAVLRPNKIERFAKSTIESAKQCRRLHLMRVDEPRTPEGVLADAGDGLKLIATPGVSAIPDLSARIDACEKALVLVGPEGGFSSAEQQAAIGAGCMPWSIAGHVLRIETAATAAAAILRYLTRG